MVNIGNAAKVINADNALDKTYNKVLLNGETLILDFIRYITLLSSVRKAFLS
ncbi:hypothetical protein VCRA217O317_220053 [Vibrio crassostreae]|nr:hypothetical protein VCRA2117O328_300004 [Vibrio crassostreae]CAK2771378.1 hypothetical protein VCRA217O317_220053 [Vibrio crassostreae]